MWLVGWPLRAIRMDTWDPPVWVVNKSASSCGQYRVFDWVRALANHRFRFQLLTNGVTLSKRVFLEGKGLNITFVTVFVGDTTTKIPTTSPLLRQFGMEFLAEKWQEYQWWGVNRLSGKVTCHSNHKPNIIIFIINSAFQFPKAILHFPSGVPTWGIRIMPWVQYSR